MANRNPRNFITVDEAENIYKLYTGGMLLKEVAQKIGRTESSLSYILKLYIKLHPEAAEAISKQKKQNNRFKGGLLSKRKQAATDMATIKGLLEYTQDQRHKFWYLYEQTKYPMLEFIITSLDDAMQNMKEDIEERKNEVAPANW